ncbi:hypothetical protein X975_14938, partial [Stegodyphus mimosarum]
MESTSNGKLECKVTTEEELLELAKKEILRDTKCASMRAEQFGAHSWAKPQKYVPSKRFLKYMLINASKSNQTGRFNPEWKGKDKSFKRTSENPKQSFSKHNAGKSKEEHSKNYSNRQSPHRNEKTVSRHGHRDKKHSSNFSQRKHNKSESQNIV